MPPKIEKLSIKEAFLRIAEGFDGDIRRTSMTTSGICQAVNYLQSRRLITSNTRGAMMSILQKYVKCFSNYNKLWLYHPRQPFWMDQSMRNDRKYHPRLDKFRRDDCITLAFNFHLMDVKYD